MILGLLYLLKLSPGSVLVLPDSATLLNTLLHPLRLSQPIEERISRILYLANDLKPTESLLYYGNSQADLEAGAYLARPTLHTTAIYSKLCLRHAIPSSPTSLVTGTNPGAPGN